MSRIGKSPITIPEGVTVTVENAVVKVAGPKGELEQSYDTAINIDIADNVITFTRPSENKDHRSKHGLYRALINNMIEGVTKGYVKELELRCRFPCSISRSAIDSNLGYSHRYGASKRD